MRIEAFHVRAGGVVVECAGLSHGPLNESGKWAFFFSAMHGPADTLEDEYTGSTPRGLVGEGYSVVTFSPPGHGQFGVMEGGEPRNGLEVFREQLVSGQDVVQEHFERTRAVRDHLETLSRGSLGEIVVGGISRGAYAAMISAAALGPAVDAALLYAPVTRLTTLREFHGFEEAPLVAANHLLAWIERMPALSLYANIGCDDERVGTEDCLCLFRQLHRAGKLRDDSVMKVFPVSGHTTQPEPGRTAEAMAWLWGRAPTRPAPQGM